MLIRSQSKKYIFNFDNIDSIYIDKYQKYRICLEVVGKPTTWYKIGEYETEERALEVLDEIQDAYRSYKLVHSYDPVFEMPEV